MSSTQGRGVSAVRGHRALSAPSSFALSIGLVRCRSAPDSKHSGTASFSSQAVTVMMTQAPGPSRAWYRREIKQLVYQAIVD